MVDFVFRLVLVEFWMTLIQHGQLPVLSFCDSILEITLWLEIVVCHF